MKTVKTILNSKYFMFTITTTYFISNKFRIFNNFILFYILLWFITGIGRKRNMESNWNIF